MENDLAAARNNMVDSQVRPADVNDLNIVGAMRRLPREVVCGGQTHLAYADTEVQYAPGRWLLRPRDAGKLLQSVAPRAGERALALSAPYLAMVLKDMGLEVDEADAADGPPGSGYDVIVCEGAVAETPPTWIEALAVDGRLGVIVRPGPVGQAVIWVKSENSAGRRIPFDSSAPLLAGFEPKTVFAF